MAEAGKIWGQLRRAQPNKVDQDKPDNKTSATITDEMLLQPTTVC